MWDFEDVHTRVDFSLQVGGFGACSPQKFLNLGSQKCHLLVLCGVFSINNAAKCSRKLFILTITLVFFVSYKKIPKKQRQVTSKG